MSIPQNERSIVRDLGKQVAEIAQLPVMRERRAMWKRHNSLERVRPMILVFPEGAWREMLPESELQCSHPTARSVEDYLRGRIVYFNQLHDDTVIEDEYVVRKAISSTGWGLEFKQIDSGAARGAWAFDPVVHTADDLKKITAPEVTHDEVETQRRLDEVQGLIGDLLRVSLKGIGHIGFHPMAIYCRLRGLERVMWDMCENPDMLHEAMSRLEEAYRGMVRQYEELNLLSLNNDNTYHSSGGNGYTDELPKEGFDPERVRPCDMWASAEAQELAQVGPEMHEEFCLQYERRLLEPFGLNGYGCCEDLGQKLDYVFQIPNIRRISISPFAKVEPCAEKLQGDYIFSWKPHPAHLVGAFDPEHIRRYIQHALDATRGCVIEMVLKDTHTCENQPERFTIWTDIARELAEAY